MISRLDAGWLAARGQRGQGLVEYALILLLVALVVIIALVTTGSQLQQEFNNILTSLPF